MAKGKPTPVNRPYNTDRKDGESDQQYFRRLAKAADQRLVRIEQLAKTDKSFKGATKFAYARAVKDIQRYSPGAKRFNQGIAKLDKRTLKEKTEDVKRFLESSTSTKSGIIDDYQKRAETLNEKYGTDFDWKDLAEYFGKGQHDKISRQIKGSDTQVKAVGVIQQVEKKIADGVGENLSITAEGPVKEAAIRILKNRKYLASHVYTAEDRKKLKEAIKALPEV